MASIGEPGVLTIKLINRGVLAVVAGAVLAGCGSVGADVRTATPTAAGASAGPAARERCLAAAAESRGQVADVRAAYPSTAGRVAAWQERWAERDGKRGAVSQWREHAANEAVTVCYLDGQFPAPRPPDVNPGKGMADRAILVVGGNGQAVPFVVGFQADVPVEDPS
jgi:hypothetical protein